MDLSEEQKQEVTNWVREGVKLAEIQRRLEDQFNLALTYMEVRFMVDDLGVEMVDDPSDSVSDDPTVQDAGGEAQADEPELVEDDAIPFDDNAGSTSVSVSVDKVQRPGALVSGQVTFSDGKRASWQVDQMGRLALIPEVEGYQPQPDDIQAFQMELQRELQKSGM